MDVTVLGAGSWGTALAILLARNGHRVRVHGRNASALMSLHERHENVRYLPGFAIPRDVEVVLDARALEPCDLWLVAVPAAGAREAFGLIRGEAPRIGIASKGLEGLTAKLLSEVAAEVIPDAQIGAVSGPNLAVEIVRGIPTAAVAASPLESMAETIRNALMCRTYRVYLSDDLVGVELAGAVKNVLAIGAGISDGLGFGDNTKASLLARGLHEMTSLGLALGARLDTFLGVAGVGDLFATAVSTLSRNYRVGRMVGEGMPISAALEAVGQVAEGVSTSEAVLVLAERLGVEVPVLTAIESVLLGRVDAQVAVSLLMERQPKREGFLRPERRKD